MKTLILLLACIALVAAQQGEKGQKGEPGQAGPQGSPGLPGVCSGSCTGGGVRNIGKKICHGCTQWNVDELAFAIGESDINPLIFLFSILLLNSSNSKFPIPKPLLQRTIDFCNRG